MVWINPEIKNPKDGSKVITTSSVGLFWGVFSTHGNGYVYVEGKKDDWINWEEIYEWIYYPKHFK